MRRIDHVVIGVSDWEAANAFYVEVVGAELVDKGNGTFAYRFGDQQLNAHGPGMSPSPVARDPVRPGGSDLCFVWEGPIERAVEHLEEQGVDVEEGPVERHGPGGRGQSVYFRDPDGSLLEFLSYD